MRRIQSLGFGTLLCTAFSASALAQTTVATAANSDDRVLRTTGDTSGPKASQPRAAQILIDEAVKTAKANNKAVFVHFGASWCGYCHMLDKFLSASEVSPVMAAHYVIVSLDVQEQGDKKALENPGADSVMQATGVNGVPSFFFLDGQGKQIASSMVMPPQGDNMGFPALPEEIKMFDALLQKTAPRMTEGDRAKVGEYLTNTAKSLASH